MGNFIDGGLVPEHDPMFNGSWMTFSIRKPMAKQSAITQRKTYFILINPDSLPHEPGYLGAVISRHRTMQAALNAQDRAHREACEPITTAVYSNPTMPRVTEYLATGYMLKPAPVHVRTILKGRP